MDNQQASESYHETASDKKIRSIKQSQKNYASYLRLFLIFSHEQTWLQPQALNYADWSTALQLTTLFYD